MSWRYIARLNLFSLILVSSSGAFAQGVITIHDFGRQDGANPQSAVVFDQAGNLYGTTALGGGNGNGIAFSLTPPDSGTLWEESVLYQFTVAPDAATPVAPLLLVAPGRLFGTSLEGGAQNLGSVFEIRQVNQNLWREQVIYSFGSFAKDGTLPNAWLLPARP